jgi:hypothetical protein
MLPSFIVPYSIRAIARRPGLHTAGRDLRVFMVGPNPRLPNSMPESCNIWRKPCIGAEWGIIKASVPRGTDIIVEQRPVDQNGASLAGAPTMYPHFAVVRQITAEVRNAVLTCKSIEIKAANRSEKVFVGDTIINNWAMRSWDDSIPAFATAYEAYIYGIMHCPGFKTSSLVFDV